MQMKIEHLIQFGVINIDKLAGPTSHQVAEYTRRILGVKRSGHSGTLDPGVTGCLPVALGHATRIIELLMGREKEYICVMELHQDVGEQKLRETINSFLGKIIQLPPVKSAVKRVEREREIYEIEILEIKDREVLFRVLCEAGTYIRKLVHDIGEKLETGAHMKELRRTRAGIFKEGGDGAEAEDRLGEAVTLNDLRDAYEYWKQGKEEGDKIKEQEGEKLLRKYIHPVEFVVKDFPKVYVNDLGRKFVSNGQNLLETSITRIDVGSIGSKRKDTVAVMYDSKLIALGILVKDANKINCLGKKASEKSERNDLAVKIYKVFTRPD